MLPSLIFVDVVFELFKFLGRKNCELFKLKNGTLSLLDHILSSDYKSNIKRGSIYSNYNGDAFFERDDFTPNHYAITL